MAELEYARLHITPFTPALLNTIIPASVLPNVRNISYHSLQTFPEKGYGYVDLPAMDAEKVKKRLNGSILKGTKVKIEKARPQKDVVLEIEEPEKPKKEKKKRKRDELPGVDIGERHVKRGWTTPAKDVGKNKDKEKTLIKSKYTTGPECLFKTVLPPNVASSSKSTDAKAYKKKKSKKSGKEATVHEFAKTTKYATFLKSSSGLKKPKAVAEYVEGKGWVDEDGDLIEEEKKSKKSKRRKMETKSKSEPEPVVDSASSSLSEESESEKELSEAQPSHVGVESSMPSTKPSRKMDEKSDSSSLDDPDSAEAQEGGKGKDIPEKDFSDSDSDSDSSSSENESEPKELQLTPTSRPQSSSGPALSIKIPEVSSTPSVHPLEALYKKPKLNSSNKPSDTPSFTFFGGDGNDAEIEVESHLQVPLTPFTQRDFEFRGIRSAAPTPDTAFHNRKFMWPVEKNIEEEDGPQSSSPIRKDEGTDEKDEKSGEPESEFQKWFWENRGNVNRAWKKRRKVVAKEGRQRENRKKHDI